MKLHQSIASACLIALGALAFSDAATAGLVIENADTVTANWTVTTTGGPGPASTLSRPDNSGLNGVGKGLVLEYPTNAEWNQTRLQTTAVAGDLTAYRGGSIQLNYRTLGTEVSEGNYVLEQNHPGSLHVYLFDTFGRFLPYDINFAGGLGWDLNGDWHSIEIALPDVVGYTNEDIRSRTFFDGVAATSATLPTPGPKQGFAGADWEAEWNSFWQNIAYVNIYVGRAGSAYNSTGAIVLDNLQVVPEPMSLGIIATASAAFLVRRKR